MGFEHAWLERLARDNGVAYSDDDKKSFKKLTADQEVHQLSSGVNSIQPFPLHHWLNGRLS